MPTANELYNMARQQHQGGNFAQAEPLYQLAIEADSGHSGALHMLGLLAHQTGRPEAALAFLQRAVAADPADANLHNNLGNALKDQGQFVQAIACYRYALALNPGLANTHYNLGNALLDQEQPDAAIAAYREALRISPNTPQALNNLGSALKEKEQLDDAAECFRRALNIKPNYADAHCNLGNTLKDQGRLKEADECYRQALSIDPGHKPTLWNRCLVRLLQGDFASAWPNFELRLTRPGTAPRTFLQPRWDGAPLQGKTILVYAELGLGDTIQFARYLPLVKERGGVVVFECQPALVSSPRGGSQAPFTRWNGVDHIVAAGGQLPPFDVHVPLLSLPGLFCTTRTNIPPTSPYLTADPQLIEHWRQEMGRPARCNPAFTDGKATTTHAVGIAWQADPKHPGHRHKSFPLACFEALAKVEEVRLFSLQVGTGADQLTAAPFPVTDLAGRFDLSSFGDLAAALMNLDLVVTVDTAAAHLAGALGLPVWVPLPFVPDWRWLLDRFDSPWYPTMRLFRQSRPGDWSEVFARMGRALAERLDHTRGPWYPDIR